MNKVYYGLLCILHIISLPFLCLLSCKTKYKKSIPSRFLFPKNHSKESYDIWLHACSVGEIQSLQALINKIPESQTIFLTAITQTGIQKAQELYGIKKNITIDYLPFETLLPFFAPTCKKLFVFEAELWLMLFVYAKKQGVITKLINARISTRSFSRYYKLRFFYKHLFGYIDYILSQSDDDTQRLQKLGAKNTQTLGNLKTTNAIIPTKLYTKPKRLVIIAASTHEGEEKKILEGLKKTYLHWESQSSTPIDKNHNDNNNTSYLQAPCNETQSNTEQSITKDSSNALFIIVPRHPERFDSVYTLCTQYFNTLRFSDIQTTKNPQTTLDLDNLQTNVLLVDTIGELINFYAISDIVILGGSFTKIGGHNPLEVATFHNVLLSGKEIFNQKALFKLVQNYYLIHEDQIFQYLQQYQKLKKTNIDSLAHTNMLEKILT